MSLLAPIVQRLIARLDAGDRRVLLWGAPDTGASLVLARLLEERRCAVVEVSSREDARAALIEDRSEPRVVAWVSREGLRADSYVECVRPTIEQCVCWMRERLERDGVALSADGDAGLRALIDGAERSPAAMMRAVSLLPLLPVDALIERCARAERALRLRGQRTQHPLLRCSWPEPLSLSDFERELLAMLAARRAPMSIDEIEESVKCDALESLCALRERGLLIADESRRWSVSFTVASALASDEAGAAALTVARERERERALGLARARVVQWRTSGHSDALDAIERDGASLRAVVDEDSAAPELDSAYAALALALVIERREGVDRAAQWLETAMSRWSRGSEPWAMLAVERARLHRLRSEWPSAAALLRALPDRGMPIDVEAHALVERAFERRITAPSEAVALVRRASQAFASMGYDHEQIQCSIALGSLAFWRASLDEAIDHYEQSRARASMIGARRAEATALTNLCLCHAMRGDDAAATTAGSLAAEHFLALGDIGAHGTTLGHLGMIALQRGRLDQAEFRFAEAESLLERAGYVEQRRYAQFNRAEVALERGRLDEADAGLARVEASLAEQPDAYTMVHVAALRADLCERAGRFVDALAALDRGLRAGAWSPREVAALIVARRVRLLARLGEREASREAERAARETLSSIRLAELRIAAAIALGHAATLRGERCGDGAVAAANELAIALGPAWGVARAKGGESAVESLPVRRACAAYWRDLPAADRVAIEWRARDPDARAVCVDEALGLARLANGAVIARASRRNAFVLLSLLARACPGQLSKEELIESLWPDERMQRAAAANRLNNAVAQLRALGTAALVAREGERYRLVVDAGVVLSGAPLSVFDRWGS